MNATVNIAAALVERAREHPDVVALSQTRWLIQSSIIGIRKYQITFGELNAESDRLARGLSRLGIARGMRTVLMVPPSPEFFALTFALFKVGAVSVLIDPGMGVKNLGVCIAEAEPEAFIGVTKAHLARLALGWGKKTIRHRVTVGMRLFWGGWSLARVRREGVPGEPILAQTSSDEMAAILFTSGSTGVAKGAVYTHGIFAAQVDYLRSMYGIGSGEIDLPTFPLFGLFAPALGMTAVVPEMDFTRPGRVKPENIRLPARMEKVTNLFGSPALLRRVFLEGQPTPEEFQTLRRVISAGAPVSAKVIRRVVECLPPGVQVHTPYGATEALPVATIGSDEILGETAALTEQGKGVCVGRPIAGMTVRVIRITDAPIETWSDELLLGGVEIGEVTVCGPVVTRSYYNRPEATALHKIRNGDVVWHRMGDVGYLDAQGRIWFCGRKSQRVITTDHGTLFTIPCEGVFNAHPHVFRTALVGVVRNGKTVAELCVEIDPDAKGADAAKVLRELAELGARYEHTQSIRRFHVHPGFPVDIRHNAKIFREKLAVWVARR